MRIPSRSIGVWLMLGLALQARAVDDAPAPEGALPREGRHCFGEPRPRWLATTTLAGALNPKGLELQLEAGRCLPLITAPGILFDFTNLQFGLLAYLAPVYAMPGAFVSIAPLSVIELRAEAAGVAQWPIGLDGAGYFPLPSAQAPWSVLPASSGVAAQGYLVNLAGTLRFELPLADRWSLLAVNMASFQLWRLGDAPAYYNTRHDLPMARRDTLFKDVALLLLQHAPNHRLKLRFGITGDFTRVTSTGYRQDVVAALLAASFARWPGPASETRLFLRLGAYTAHAYHQGEAQLIAGVSTTFDLSPGAAR
jgi:hypothetical protein